MKEAGHSEVCFWWGGTACCAVKGIDRRSQGRHQVSDRLPSRSTQKQLFSACLSDLQLIRSSVTLVSCCFKTVYLSPHLSAFGSRTTFYLYLIPSYFVWCLTKQILSRSQDYQSLNKPRTTAAGEGSKWRKYAVWTHRAAHATREHL